MTHHYDNFDCLILCFFESYQTLKESKIDCRDMVRTLNVTLDNREFEQMEKVKEELDLTWQEFVLQATEALAERENLD